MPTSIRISPRLVLGLFVLAAGVVLTLGNLDYIDVDHVWRWWPLLLIGVGLAKSTQSVGSSGRSGGLIIAGVGTLLLLNSLRILRFDFWELWPIALVALGITMVWSSITRHRQAQGASASGSAPASAAAVVHAVAVLGSSVRGSNSQEFRGGEATAFLGSCEIDLRQASIAGNEAVLDTLAFWGGIDIRIPEDWTVVLQGMPLMGSFEDKTRRPATPTKQLVIKGLAMMGGVEITN